MKLFRQCCFLLAFPFLPAPLAAQQPTGVLPQVIVRSNPIYPPIARIAHIQGDVRVKVTTDGASVVSAEAESGPPLLYKNTLDSVRTWKFASHTPATFYLQFHFRLMEENQIAFEESPGVIQIAAQLPDLYVGSYSSTDLGKWQARIKTRTGVSRKTLWISREGKYGESLAVSVKDAGTACPEPNYGNFEGKFVEFVMSRPAGDDEFETIFVGRLTGHKIAGTFVDQDGVTGTWNAVRVAASAADGELMPDGCPMRTIE